MKKMFLVVLDYEENSEGMFSDVGVEVTFDNQLFELKERGHIETYEDALAYEVSESDFDKVIQIVDKD